VRGDLPPGLQLSQAVHAAQEFVFRERATARAWRRASNTLVVVVVPDVAALRALARDARAAGVLTVAFRDLDLAPRLTSLALAPCAAARALCRRWPLALRQPLHAAGRETVA